MQSHCNPHTSTSRPVAYTLQAGLDGGGGGWGGRGRFRLGQGLRRARCSYDLSNTRARDVYKYTWISLSAHILIQTSSLRGTLHLFAFDPRDDKE